jgi:hypothetical protein
LIPVILEKELLKKEGHIEIFRDKH